MILLRTDRVKVVSSVPSGYEAVLAIRGPGDIVEPAQGCALDFDLPVSCHWFRQRSVDPGSYEVQVRWVQVGPGGSRGPAPAA